MATVKVRAWFNIAATTLWGHSNIKSIWLVTDTN